jgi:tetratricopeptide (TPR) repeat protein
MKKIVLAMLLVAAVAAVAQSTSAPVPQGAAPVPQGAAPVPQGAAPVPQGAAPVPQGAAPVPQGAAPVPAAPQKKEIKDPAEYNAYVGAVQQQDAAAKISGLEAFVTQYPNSVMKEDALELLMGAYQQTANQPKTLETAQKVLLANPCNIRALALLVYTKRALAEAGQNAQQNLADAGQNGVKGLQCLQTVTKPDGTAAPDWEKLKAQTAVIFNGAAGMSAFSAKDYAKAQQYLRASVEGDPTNLRDVYPLALAYLTAGPTEKDIDGLFFIARAANLAQGAGKDQITKFGKSKYNKYHGSEEGWSDLMAKAATATLPTGITITQYVPPTPAEQCADLLKTKKTQEMSFAEWQLCLSEGKPEDADKVWSVLKGKPLQMGAHIISIDSSSKTTTKLQLAGSEDDVEAKRADIDLTMTAAIPAKQMPTADTDFQFEGTPVSYVAKPFVMTMNEGALLVKAAPKAPPKKKPAAH